MLPSGLEPREQSADRFSLTDKGSSLAKTGTSRLPHSAEKRQVSFSKAVWIRHQRIKCRVGKRGTEGGGVEGDEKKVHLYVDRNSAGLAASPPHRLSGSSWTGRCCLTLKEPWDKTRVSTWYRLFKKTHSQASGDIAVVNVKLLRHFKLIPGQGFQFIKLYQIIWKLISFWNFEVSTPKWLQISSLVKFPLEEFSILLNIICSFTLYSCACVCAGGRQWARASQTRAWSQFCLPTTRVPGIERRSSGLVAITFIHSAVLPDQKGFNFSYMGKKKASQI